MADSRAAALKRLKDILPCEANNRCDYDNTCRHHRWLAEFAAVEQAAPERARCSACGELWSHHGNPNRCPRQELADACAAILEADAMLIRRPYTVGYPDYMAWLALPAVVEARKGETG
jgi:hypothetical protein